MHWTWPFLDALVRHDSILLRSAFSRQKLAFRSDLLRFFAPILEDGVFCRRHDKVLLFSYLVDEADALLQLVDSPRIQACLIRIPQPVFGELAFRITRHRNLIGTVLIQQFRQSNSANARKST